MPGIARATLSGDEIRQMPTDWVAVGQVSRLYLYPVKSFAACPVPVMFCLPTGGLSVLSSTEGSAPVADRQFVVLNSRTGKVATGRRYPIMTRIKARLDGSDEQQLVLNLEGHPEHVVSIPQTEKSEAVKEIDIFGEKVKGEHVGGDETARWLTHAIAGNKDSTEMILLMHRLGKTTRVEKEASKFRPLEISTDVPYFADGCPYLLLSEGSVSELNTRLKNGGHGLQVEETRFRPNVYVTGTDLVPFAENSWSYIKIGDSVVFRNGSPCTRCLFTTVNPMTGTKEDSGQPLKLLKEFRTTEAEDEVKEYKNSPFFGINLGTEVEGEIRVGDTVWVRRSEADSTRSNKK